MGRFLRTIGVHKHLSVDAQVQAGKATGTDMDSKHKDFLASLIDLLDKKQIVAIEPESFLHKEKYDALPEDARSLVDYALLNISDQVRRIEWYYRSTSTPNASPELQTMIDYFWDMKKRLEDKYGDILKF